MDFFTDAQGVVEATWEKALKGDIEAIAWVVLVVLSLGCLFVLILNALTGAKDGRVLPPLYREGLPFLGNLMAFASKPIDFVRRGYDKHGDCFTIKVLNKRLTFMLSPKAHEIAFLSKDADVGMGEIYSFTVPVFGPGIVYDADLEERYFNFRMLGTGLSVNKLRSYVPFLVDECEKYFAKWDDEGEVDLSEEFSKLVLMTASRCLLGKEVREEMFDEAAHFIEDLERGMNFLSIFAPYLPTDAHRKRDQARKDMQQLFERILNKRRASGIEGDDLVQVFMTSTRKDGTKLDDYSIVGLLIAAIFGGQHTSTITATWIGLHLAQERDYLAKVREEQEKMNAEFGEINFDSLNKMDTLHRCMKETLRMHPPLVLLMRTVENEKKFKEYSLPKGDILLMSPAVTGRLPELWTNPNKWDPERFSEARSEDKKARFTFVGFGGGRHSCMGEQFAFLQVKTIWSVFLREFDIEPVGPLDDSKFVSWSRKYYVGEQEEWSF